ncbi:MAG: hypothetical protein R3314_09680 [Longimicrobiales bacterium]|nr:hypothetical protein [Longimicrobiales bacterium]
MSGIGVGLARWSATLLMLPGLLVAAAASGQTLTLREQPSSASLLCDPTLRAPTCGFGDPAEVERLVNAATQAMILGDLVEADRYLTEALELDACAVEATYLHGRIIAQTEDLAAASEWFCRYLTLAPFGASAEEARRRLDQAVENGAATELQVMFQEGVELYLSGDLEAADAAFSAVLERHPAPEAIYNRAIVRLAMERPLEVRSDLRRYLQLRPDGEDADVIRAALEVPARAWTSRSPGAAFVLGAVLPGAGQYYTGRTWYGLAVTGLVAGSIVTGYFFKQTTIQCRAPDPSGDCPQDAIVSRETTRPLLVPALGVGAGLMLVTAIEAAIHAGGRGPPLTVAGSGGLRLEIAARPRPSGALDIHLIRFRH